MMVVDSSVWIDYFNGRETRQTNHLDRLLGRTPIVMGEPILTEVLQGFQNDRDFRTARDLLLRIPFMPILGRELALESAANYRRLRKSGVTVRKTMDVMIGTFCIHYQLSLLHDDRDFAPMARLLGLDVVIP